MEWNDIYIYNIYNYIRLQAFCTQHPIFTKDLSSFPKSVGCCCYSGNVCSIAGIGHWWKKPPSRCPGNFGAWFGNGFGGDGFGGLPPSGHALWPRTGDEKIRAYPKRKPAKGEPKEFALLWSTLRHIADRLWIINRVCPESEMLGKCQDTQNGNLDGY